VQAHPAGRRARSGATTTAAAVQAAQAAASGPATGREATTPSLLDPSPTPDHPEECRPNAARRGVFSSLESLGVTKKELADRFGRPVDQVATRRLTALVREVITSQRAGLGRQQELPVNDQDVA
jgi:hypothetical protein